MGEQVDRFAEAITWGYAVRMMNHFDHAVFPTATQQSAFMSKGLEVPSAVISNGVNTARYRPKRGLEPERWDELPRGPRLLFVGRLAKDKNIELLIRAMPRIWNETRGHLLLVGSGDDRERLEGIVHEFGVDHCIHFLGFVPEIDLPALYREADLFVIASECEVQSIPTLQAAASGLPVVAVRAGALPELARDATNGTLVKPNDADAFASAVRKILTDPALGARYSQASLTIGRYHSERRTFQTYEQLYFKLVRSKWVDHRVVREPMTIRKPTELRTSQEGHR
jgi:glycosyltransferase involved in cell wall biosynthesis